MPECVYKHLDEIYQVFGGYSAYELEQLTHQEQPWVHARGDLAENAVCRNIIDKKLTAEFYRGMMAA